MKIINSIKKLFECEKCIYCGENISMEHEIFCCKRTLDYDIRIESISLPTNEQMIQIIKSRR